MAWYKSGSVNVTNGNATVYGNGTLWVDVSILYSGDVWVGPDGRLYEIASIQSNTQLTLASPYLGTTANAQSYAIMPIGLLPSALAQQVKTTLSTANTALSQAVRFDANQNLTSGQKATARSNIGATAAADVGLGLLSKSVAGGVDVVLTTDEAASLFYEFTGALTANINVVVPANVRQFFVRNFTSGAYTLTVKTQTGTGVKVLQGTRIHLECDGTNVLAPTTEAGAVTVDASGNVGVGTAAAFNAGYTGVQINSTGPGSQLRLTNPTTGATGGSGLGISVDVSAGYVWNFSNMPLVFGTNNAERLRIDSTGNVGIGTGTSIVSKFHVNNPTAAATYATVGNTNNGLMFGVDASGVGIIQSFGNQTIAFGSYNSGGTATERMRLDINGNLGVGTTSPGAKLHLMNGDIVVHSYANLGQKVGGLYFRDYTGYASPMQAGIESWVPSGAAGVDFQDLRFFTVYGNPANGASSGIQERMRITTDGNVLVGLTGSQNIGKFQIGMSDAEGTAVMGAVKNGVAQAFGFFLGGAQGYNAAASVQVVAKNTVTSRSINAGGTINASGADYAEYMTKAPECGVIEPGQIAGVNAAGLLVDTWADAVSFLIKSTNPSYVGGDGWGSGEALGIHRLTVPVLQASDYTGAPKPGEEPVAPIEPEMPAEPVKPEPPVVPPAPIAPEDATDDEKVAYAVLGIQYQAAIEAQAATYQAAVDAQAEQYQADLERYAAMMAVYQELLAKYQEDKAAYDSALADYQADVAAYAEKIESERLYFDAITMPAYQAELAKFEQVLEAARQRVDRMAYCGQVPVNVTGAKPGQYVVPVQDGEGIAGQLVDDDAISFAQYRRAVGVVQNILADGRANIRVKVV